ncbi:MAG: hypothetical protein IJU34_03495 [Bacteroidales bacterium]|nr:hypothetical protein [Bacteroidales bacterium]
MKRAHLFLLLLLSLLLAGCKGEGIKDISVTSARIVSIVPEGLTGLSALVEVEIHNPTVAFEITDLHGLARYRDQDAFSAYADQLIVAGHTDKVYRVPVRGQIADGFNPFQLLRLIGNESAYDDVTFSVDGRVSLRGGIGKNIEIKDIPLSSILNKPVQNEQTEME